MSKLRSRKIRTHVDSGIPYSADCELGGYFDGKDSYLWIGMDNECIGVLSGDRLYRLAKTFVKHFEQGE